MQAEMTHREKYYLLYYHCLGYAALYWTTMWWLWTTASFCCIDVLPGSLLLIQVIFLQCCCWVFRYYIIVIVCCVWLSVWTLILTRLQLPQLFISKFHNNLMSSIPVILLTNTEVNRNHSVLGEYIYIFNLILKFSALWSKVVFPAAQCFLFQVPNAHSDHPYIKKQQVG